MVQRLCVCMNLCMGVRVRVLGCMGVCVCVGEWESGSEGGWMEECMRLRA